MSEFLDYGIDTIDYETNLPKPIVKEHDGIQVVRDDLIEGGTKRRALPMLNQLNMRSLFMLHQDKVMLSYLWHMPVRTWVESVRLLFHKERGIG